MTGEIHRPVIIPILLVNLIGYTLLVSVVGLLLLALNLPPFLSYPLLGLVALFVGVLLALRTAWAYWRHVTESYLVDADALVIKRGWAVRTEGRVFLRNVAEARAVVPLGLRIFGVGSVVVSTNDGREHVLYNTKDPEGIAEKIKPTSGEPVFRPTVG
jgi:membrane protein YdbS with pleckstrin-like domain